jgi:D-alanyl-D-alanine dipeptidase
VERAIKRLLSIFLIILFLAPGINILANLASEQENGIPEGFVYVDEWIPDVILEVRYYSDDNFVGSRVDGYLAPKVILTMEAAEVLAEVADEMRAQGLVLKLFDGYRPQEAVNHFIRWAEDVEDQKMKDKYYPEVDKKDVFKLGYIAKRSGHSRGSTIDLTLVDIVTCEELDMGSSFDFFGEISHHGTDKISEEQFKNREILRVVMEKYGFEPYSEEWWHYTLLNEPYPYTYYDFPVQ